jgi:sigma-B regulation protein RsbU (phosphoserine phosphatase)
MQSELATAQTVQETLFPNNEAELHGLRIAGYYEPASECGGDWWHYFKVGDKVYLWIGDATGHGAPAALITSAAKSAATIIERFEEVLPISAASALTLLNRAIFEVSKGKIMMTFFLACYDAKTKVMSYSNASHEAPYLMKKLDRPTKRKDLIPLNEINNPRLGEARDTIYKETSITLEPGDRVFFYTDGLTDIQNQENEAWGERQFLKTLIEVVEGAPPAHESVYRMREALILHRRRAPLIDDVTFFMIEVPVAELAMGEIFEMPSGESAV